MAAINSPAYDMNGNLVTVALEDGDYSKLPPGLFVSPGQAAIASGRMQSPASGGMADPSVYANSWGALTGAGGSTGGFVPTPNNNAENLARVQALAKTDPQAAHALNAQLFGGSSGIGVPAPTPTPTPTPTNTGFDALSGSGSATVNRPASTTSSATQSQATAPSDMVPNTPATAAANAAMNQNAAQATQPTSMTGGFNNLSPSTPGATTTPVTPPAVTSPVVATPPTVQPPAVNVPGSTSDSGLTQYLSAHPDIANNWNNSTDLQNQYGSLQNYVKAHVAAHGTDAEKAWASTLAVPNSNTTQVNANPDDNYRQTQAGQQGGTFQTVGGTNFAQNQVGTQTNNQTQQQTGTSQQNVNQRNTTEQATEGTQQTQQTGTVGNVGTTRTGVDNAMGFDRLIQSQIAPATAADTTRQGFLTDLVQTGGANLNSQFDQGIRQALTGPQTTGAGDSARARMAGYAAAEIARKNTGDRLAAAQQLSGPTAVTTLTGAATPFFGSKTTTDNTQTVNMNNLVNTSGLSRGFQDLVSNTTGSTASNTSQSGTQTNASSTAGGQSEVQAGSASGNSLQTAAGKIPQAQQVSTGGGGCIICTAGMHHGLWNRPRLLRRVIRHKIVNHWPRFKYAARGYFFLFGPVAKLALRSRLVSRLTMPIANAVVYEEARLSGLALPLRPVPWLLHWTWHGLCAIVGRLPIRNDVADKELLAVARKHQILFQVGA